MALSTQARARARVDFLASRKTIDETDAMEIADCCYSVFKKSFQEAAIQHNMDIDDCLAAIRPKVIVTIPKYNKHKDPSMWCYLAKVLRNLRLEMISHGRTWDKSKVRERDVSVRVKPSNGGKCKFLRFGRPHQLIVEYVSNSPSKSSVCGGIDTSVACISGIYNGRGMSPAVSDPLDEHTAILAIGQLQLSETERELINRVLAGEKLRRSDVKRLRANSQLVEILTTGCQ